MSLSVPTDFTQPTTYELIPADNHVGVCVGFLDLGTHLESFQGAPPKPTHKVKLLFELPGVARANNEPAIIGIKVNYSMNEKANMRQMLDRWLGSDWTDHFKGQSWTFLIGRPAMVLVENGPSKRDPKRMSAWIKSVSKFPKGMSAPEPQSEARWLDLSDLKLPSWLSAWDADLIRQSSEYASSRFADEAPSPKEGAHQPATSGVGLGSPLKGSSPYAHAGNHNEDFDETATASDSGSVPFDNRY